MAADSAVALAQELGLIMALERMIRLAQSKQYKSVASARELAAAVEGVSDESTPVEREFATRSFVSTAHRSRDRRRARRRSNLHTLL